MEPGETLAEAASRELEEEVGIATSPDSLVFSGTLRFVFLENSEWNQVVSVYRFGPYA